MQSIAYQFLLCGDRYSLTDVYDSAECFRQPEAETLFKCFLYSVGITTLPLSF